MTKLKYCLYSWRQYIAFRMYVGFRFDKIWCISTKLRICIRNVCILERIQNLIFGDSESFSSKGIYGPHTWQHKKYVLCPSMIYCLYDVYWVHIWPDMVHINKTQDMYRKCPYSRKNQNSIFEDSWSFRPVAVYSECMSAIKLKMFTFCSLEKVQPNRRPGVVIMCKFAFTVYFWFLPKEWKSESKGPMAMWTKLQLEHPPANHAYITGWCGHKKIYNLCTLFWMFEHICLLG